MQLKLTDKRMYNQHYYYADCRLSRGLVKLLKGATIPKSKFNVLREMGFDLVISGEKPEVLKSLPDPDDAMLITGEHIAEEIP